MQTSFQVNLKFQLLAIPSLNFFMWDLKYINRQTLNNNLFQTVAFCLM